MLILSLKHQEYTTISLHESYSDSCPVSCNFKIEYSSSLFACDDLSTIKPVQLIQMSGLMSSAWFLLSYVRPHHTTAAFFLLASELNAHNQFKMLMLAYKAKNGPFSWST